MTDSHTLTIDSNRTSPGHPNAAGGTRLADGAGQSFHPRSFLWGPSTIVLTCKAHSSGELQSVKVEDPEWYGMYQDINLALRDTLQKAQFAKDGKPLSLYDIRRQFDTGTPLQPRTAAKDVTVTATTTLEGKEVGVLDALCASPAAQTILSKAAPQR